MLRSAIAHSLCTAVGLLCLSALVAPAARAQTDEPPPRDTLYCLKNPDAPSDPVTGDVCPPDDGMQNSFRPGPAGTDTIPNNPQPGYHDNGRGGNTFVNDPCLDPPPPNRPRTVQSETEIAVFGKYMIGGYNDSYGFYDNTQGLSGVAYSIDGGNTWVDQSGLPPVVPNHGPGPGNAANDSYSGDPVVVVDKSPRVFTKNSLGQTLATPIVQPAGQFYYSSIYFTGPTASSGPTDLRFPEVFSLSVNRGRFTSAPPSLLQPESVADTRCLNHPALFSTYNTQTLPKERPVWEPPVVAVKVIDPGDLLDKEWLYVNQANGELYLTYTRFSANGDTPLELVRSMDGGRTWTPPSVIVPNLADTFNQATQPAVTSTGRVIVIWISRKFDIANPHVPEILDTIQYAYSDNDGATFGPTQVIEAVNPQGEPPGYNRGRTQILDAPFINTYPHGTDLYVIYFNGKTPLQAVGGIGPFSSSADIHVASSHDNGTTFTAVKINDDAGTTSHVFPSVQVNKNGWVFAGWLDRRHDPTNELTDLWANVSHDGGLTWGHDVLQTDVATSWRVRADARPNMGDYISSELLDENQFVLIFNDGRFPPPAPTPQAATPDTIFTIANGLGVGGGP
jgi:hypothetical protein